MIIIVATIFIISPPSVGEHGFSGVDLFTWLTGQSTYQTYLKY